MKTKALSIIIGAILLAFSACKKEPDPNIQSFEITKENKTVNTTSVTIVGTYAYDGVIDGIKACVSENGGDVVEFEAELSGKDFSVEMTGLKPATEYQYHYSVDYGFSKPFVTETKTFTTYSESPTVLILEVQASEDSTSFRVKCKVVDDGGTEVTERGICWSTTFEEPTMNDSVQLDSDGGLGEYDIDFENLAPSTRYYFRAYARNVSGLGLSKPEEFRTAGETTKPEVSTVEVSDVSYNAASCLCNVSSDGGLDLEGRGISYYESTNPSLTINIAAEEVSLGEFRVQITGLQPSKEYYVRAYATNEKGPGYGEYIVFTTTDGRPTVTTSVITGITAISATGGGEVTDQGYSPVTERGICWSTSHEPTPEDSHESGGTGIGSYTCNMANLTPNETYYVRAYATNAQGTAYGAEVEFTAKEGLPVVMTYDVTGITATSAIVHGNVTDQGGSEVTERGICWSTEPSPNISGNHVSSGTGTGEFEASLTNLTPGTAYYVRAYAMNSQGLTYGEQKEFTTLATLPTVVTGEIEGTTVHGNVIDDGGATVTERGVCWSTSPNPTITNAHGSSGTGTGEYTVELTDLAPGTTYYVRAYATNREGTAYGEEKLLEKEANEPTVITNDVSNIQQTTALGGGNVTDDGGADITERGVCWSTSPNPTIANSHADDGAGGTGSFTVPMTGLTANTKYYVRAYAKNSAGKTGYGGEVEFTTSQGISAPTLTTSQVTNITQTTATGGGNVTNSGGADVTERGICWGTSQNPTIDGSHATGGTGTGTFAVNMTGLTPGTQYYVRAYAINAAGLIGYGAEVPFNTQQPTTYTITVSASPSNGGSAHVGSTTGPSSGTYNQGESCTVYATAATGYHFIRWTENGNQVSTSANYTFTVTGSRTLVAQFQINTYTISVSANPSNGGTVSGGGTYNYGQSCTLTAIANSDYTFTNWTEGGNQVSGNASYILQVTGNRTLVANFILSHEYVDLGLPSGLLWATCNIGADSPEDYGDYFAWGETQPKDTYSWSTYQYCMGSNNTLTKYCNNASYGYNGFTDNLTTLLPEDDAATAQWGNGWRMPTQAEWQELLNNTTNIWTTQNGVNGRLFTATNGNSLFLPAAGYRDGSGLYGAGTYGSFWSSSLFTGNPSDAWGLYFNSSDCDVNDSSRGHGFTVRPVRSSRQN